jgi:hypothetical protein
MSTYSSDLKLELIGTGEASGTWGADTNNNLNLVQQAIAGYEAIDVAGANVTLAMTNKTISNARNMVLNLTGTLAGTRQVLVPDSIEKVYVVKDSTTRSGNTLTIKTVSGSGVEIPAGKTIIVYSDGTNINDVFFLANIVEDTSPQLGGNLDTNSHNILIDDAHFIGDENGLEQIKFSTTSSAVNEFTIKNAATGNAPAISATGGDTNIDLNITPKGYGRFIINGQGAVQSLSEKITIEATAATGTKTFDVLTQALIYYTSNASGDWTLNVRGDGSTSLNTIMDTGESVTIAHMVTIGGSEYRNSTFQVDGSSITPEWQGGEAPTEGNVNSIDVYTYTIIKTGNAAFKVLGAQTQFA